jgi:hypothetical protein
MRQVRETKAGKSISAWVILNPEGKEVATVQAYYADSGGVTVDVFQWGKPGKEHQQGHAGGYGYDKFAAALSRLEIDGIPMTDHCGDRLTPPEGGFPQDFTPPAGYSLANWDRERGTYSDCYRMTGMRYLEAIGYRCLQAI